MILVHPLFTDPIEIQNNKINIVILEHQHLFTKFIAEIFTQVNDGTGPFLLSHDGRKLDFAKNMDIVVDVFIVIQTIVKSSIVYIHKHRIADIVVVFYIEKLLSITVKL